MLWRNGLTDKLVLEPTYSIWYGKEYLSEYEVDEFGKFNLKGPFRDICEIIGLDH